MKLSNTQKVGGGLVALLGAAAVGAIVFGGGHSVAPTQINVRPDAATGSISTSSTSSAAVAKPLAVVPRSSVVVKKPAVQEATVTNSTDSTQPAPLDPSTAPTTEAQATDPVTQGPNGGPLPSMAPPVAPPTTQKAPPGPVVSPSPTASS